MPNKTSDLLRPSLWKAFINAKKIEARAATPNPLNPSFTKYSGENAGMADGAAERMAREARYKSLAGELQRGGVLDKSDWDGGPVTRGFRRKK